LASPVDPQPFDDLALAKMRVNDLVDVVLVDKGVPDRFGVNNTHRASIASIEASGLINPDLAGSRKPERFDPRFGVLPHWFAAAIGTAGATIIALIQAKKHVALKMAHWALALQNQGSGIINACAHPRPEPALARGLRSHVEILLHCAMTHSTRPSRPNFERPIRA